LTNELNCRFYFRAHRTSFEPEFLQLIAVRLRDGSLVGRAPIDIHRVDVRRDHLHIRIQFLCEKRRAKIPVNDRFNADQFFIFVAGRDATPAYECDFSDVNPPVHAAATLRLYKDE
jgi:hypothetical protein